jgi:ankyrin repeat protein
MGSSGQLEKLVSRCAFRRLSHNRLSKNDWEWKSDPVQWLLATKVAIAGPDSGGFASAIEFCVTSIVVWKTSRSEPLHRGDLLNAACGAVVAHKGKPWAIKQLPSASTRTRVERPDFPCGDGETRETIMQRVAALSSLQLASYCGDRSLVQSLLEKGADPNAWNRYFGNAVYAAAYSGHADVVRLLVDTGAHTHHMGFYGTPLEAAAHQGHVEVMRFLLNRETSGHFTCKASYCLLYASEEGHEEAVRFLLAQPTIDVNPTNAMGQTPLLLAAQNEHRGTARLLLGRLDIEPNVYCRGHTSLLLAALWGWTDIVQLLLARPDTNPNPKNTRGNTPLAAAVDGGHEEMVEKLLKHPATDPNIANEETWTPLLMAADDGNEQIVKLLLQHPKINPDPVLDDGRTALMLARDGGHDGVARVLTEHMANKASAGGRSAPPAEVGLQLGGIPTTSNMVD